MTRGSVVAGWWHDCVTEVLKVAGVRRNVVLAGVVSAAGVAGPWLFLAAFGWLRTQGVEATPLEVVALAQRNQTIVLALMVVLGLQAYLSDAANGVLVGTLASSTRSGRTRLPAAKLLFGVVVSLVLGVACSASAALAVVVLGGRTDWSAPFWVVSTSALVAGLVLHYEFGLVVAMATRNKGLAVAIGLMVPFFLLTLAKGVVRTMSPQSGEIVDWLLPTELLSALLSWVPSGNALAQAPTSRMWLRALLLLFWLGAGAVAWIAVLRRRPLYPADQG
jgi:hypothetical protein